MACRQRQIYPAVGPLIELVKHSVGSAVVHYAYYARIVLDANSFGQLDRIPTNVPAKMDSTVSWTAWIFRVCRM